jgi:mannose-1-phosphate guanylyltransferase
MPKQLLTLVGDRSLVQATVDRVRPLVPPERILIVTEASHAEALRAQLPEIPASNVIVEPARRGTAGAVGLAAVHISRREASATMASLHSDGVVLDPEGFRASLSAAFEVAEADPWLISLGVRPSSPHTGMGYIEVGAPIREFPSCVAHRAIRFVEKPDPETAARFVREGYVWNTGMFVWGVGVILAEFARLLPQIYGPLGQIGQALGTTEEQRVVEREYGRIPMETIDYGIMERAAAIATIPSAFGWSDVGSWGELLQIGDKDADGNLFRGQHLAVGTRGTLVYGTDRPVFTLGVQDLVIVDLPDALLVCHRDEAERVKQLVEQVQLRPDWRSLL